MDIRISGKNLTVSTGIQDHLKEKIAKFEKYAPRLVDAHAILKKEKYLFEAEITLLAKNFRAYGEGTSKENIYSAIDEAYTRVEKQLKKFREKVKDHHKTDGEKSDNLKARASARSEAASRKSRPRIVMSAEFAVKPMSAEEASLQLELSGNPFLVFLNAATKQVNVIHLREDGNHGLIEPDF